MGLAAAALLGFLVLQQSVHPGAAAHRRHLQQTYVGLHTSVQLVYDADTETFVFDNGARSPPPAAIVRAVAPIPAAVGLTIVSFSGSMLILVLLLWAQSRIPVDWKDVLRRRWRRQNNAVRPDAVGQPAAPPGRETGDGNTAGSSSVDGTTAALEQQMRPASQSRSGGSVPAVEAASPSVAPPGAAIRTAAIPSPTRGSRPVDPGGPSTSRQLFSPGRSQGWGHQRVQVVPSAGS